MWFPVSQMSFIINTEWNIKHSHFSYLRKTYIKLQEKVSETQHFQTIYITNLIQIQYHASSILFISSHHFATLALQAGSQIFGCLLDASLRTAHLNERQGCHTYIYHTTLRCLEE